MIQWKDLTYKQISQLSRDTLVLVPVGTIEAHGPHLPLATDTLIPHYLCRQISKSVNCLIAPPINFGICDSLLKFPGTITISPQTFSSLLHDYLDSVINHGFKHIYLINGHGGNEEILSQLTGEYRRQINIKSKNWYDFNFVNQLKQSDCTYSGDHADRLETEMLLYACPRLVSMDKAVDDYFDWPTPDPDEYSQVMPHAVYGYPSKADPNSARILFAKITRLLIGDINQFLSKK